MYILHSTASIFNYKNLSSENHFRIPGSYTLPVLSVPNPFRICPGSPSLYQNLITPSWMHRTVLECHSLPRCLSTSTHLYRNVILTSWIHFRLYVPGCHSTILDLPPTRCVSFKPLPHIDLNFPYDYILLIGSLIICFIFVFQKFMWFLSWIHLTVPG